MDTQCSGCSHYEAIPGEPAAGWCKFFHNERLPFWAESHTANIDRFGADVMGSDGIECGAYVPEKR